jgi:peptidyl-prolyl cis-trans isomerase D
MRSSAKFVFWILAVAFIGGFLLFQTSGLIGSTPVTSTTAVATVNGSDILYLDWQRRSQQLIQQAQQSEGRSLTQDDQRRLENQAYDEMVADLLLQQEYKRRGIIVSDDEIRDYARFAPPSWVRTAPDLQTDGRFDPAKYQRLLASSQARQTGLLVALEQYFRSEVPKEKLFEQVTSGVYVTDADLWRAWQDANDSASINFVAFRPNPTGADTIISSSDLHAYYDAHKAEFDRPGHAVLSVLYIPRTVTAADSAAARDKAAKLRAEIAGGAKFEDVAKRESSDSISAMQGGDLGKGPKGRFVPDFEKAANSLKPGELSQPVLTQFGYHIIKLDSRSGDTLALHHILVRIAPSDSNAAQVDRKADALAKLVGGSDQAAKFDEAAKSMGITPFKVPAFENTPASYGGRSIPSVSAWAFNGARVGESSDLFDGEDGYYIARLDSIAPGGKTFDAVQAMVRQRVAIDRAIEREIPAATKFAQAARASSLDAAASAAKVKVESTGMVTRSGAARAFGSLGEAIGSAFVAPLNEINGPVRQQDAVFVTRTDARKPSDKEAFEKQKDALRANRLAQLRQQRIQVYLEDLRRSSNITDRRKDIMSQLKRQSAS